MRMGLGAALCLTAGLAAQPRAPIEVAKWDRRSAKRCPASPSRSRRRRRTLQTVMGTRGAMSSSSAPPTGDRTARRSSSSCKAASTISRKGLGVAASATTRRRSSRRSRGRSASRSRSCPIPTRHDSPLRHPQPGCPSWRWPAAPTTRCEAESGSSVAWNSAQAYGRHGISRDVRGRSSGTRDVALFREPT